MKFTLVVSLTFVSACGAGAIGLSPLAAATAHSVSLGQDLGRRSEQPAGIRTAVSTPTTIASAFVFDAKIPVDQVMTDEISSNVGYDWGANAPEQSGGPARHDLYMAWAQGWCPGVGIYGPCPNGGPPSLQWLNANHPDWVLWQTNKQGVPTVPAHSKSNPGPIVDFANPAVQQFWMDNYITPGLSAGYNGIAVDGPLSFDPYGAVGHYNAQQQFVKQYSGKYVDKSWAKAQTTALSDFLKLARLVRPGAEIALDQFLDCSVKEPLWALPFAHAADTIVDEEGYTDWGTRHPWTTSAPGSYCANQWLEKTKTYIQLEKAGEHLVLINAVPFHVTPYMTDTNMTARAALQWSLANYLLVKYSHTYFWFGTYQAYGFPTVPESEESVNLGRALGDMKSSQHVYVRFFKKGMALVNPSPKKSFTVSLSKATYKNLYRKNLNRVKMGPHSGLILLLRH